MRSPTCKFRGPAPSALRAQDEWYQREAQRHGFDGLDDPELRKQIQSFPTDARKQLQELPATARKQVSEIRERFTKPAGTNGAKKQTTAKAKSTTAVS